MEGYMGELDLEACIEIFKDMVREDGENVYCQDWDSGEFGAGSDMIYKFKDWFWWEDDFGFGGPYESMIEAFPQPFIAITKSTVMLRCTEWDVDEIIENLRPVDLEDDRFLEINGVEYEVSPAGEVNRTY
jgi:hypothetical protein